MTDELSQKWTEIVLPIKCNLLEHTYISWFHKYVTTHRTDFILVRFVFIFHFVYIISTMWYLSTQMIIALIWCQKFAENKWRFTTLLPLTSTWFTYYALSHLVLLLSSRLFTAIFVWTRFISYPQFIVHWILFKLSTQVVQCTARYCDNMSENNQTVFYC